MSLYFFGILIALLSPILYGFSNLIDNYYVNHSFKYIRSIIIYGDSINIIFVPLIFFVEIPHMLPLSLLPIVIGIALTEFGYRLPFYTSLKNTDTSVVTALFSIGKLFVPVIAFFMVDERLAVWQYMGLLIIVLSTLLLTKKKKIFRLDYTFFLMILTALMLSIQAVLYKYLFEQVAWGTGFFWSCIFSFLITLSVFFIPGTLRHIRQDFRMVKKRAGVFLGQGLIDKTAEMAFTYSVALIPISVTKGIGSIQPLVVLGFAVLLRNTRIGKILKEQIEPAQIKKKIFLYILIIIGTIFVVWPQ